MRHCTFCDTELPEHAQFCGHCGRLSKLPGEQNQQRSVPSSTWSLQDAPTIISDGSLPEIPHEQTLSASPQEERTLLTPYDKATWPPSRSRPANDEEDEDRKRRALVWGVPLAAADVRGPFGAPVVQGTPSVNGAPLVFGTPSPQVEVGPHTPTLYQQSSDRTLFERQNRWPQNRPVSSTGARAAKGVVTQWVIVVVTAVLVLTTAGVGVALAVSPSLALNSGLSGKAALAPGHYLSLHGSGFFPGGHITLKRDNSQNVQMATQNSVITAEKMTSPAISLLSALSLVRSSASTVTVNATGAFDASVLIGNDWGPGEHTLRATEDMFSRSATMTVNVDSTPPALSISPDNLDFGSVQKGTKTSLLLAIGNTGGKPLTWTASTTAPSWLKLQATSGEVQSAGGPQSLAISCNTVPLTPGLYSATIHLQTNGGNAAVNVSLKVVAQKQARLVVSTATLDFQTMYPDQQAVKVLSIGNTGTLKLDWQVTGNKNWISSTPASGFIQPGGVAQKVNVQVDTTGLQAGTYSATLTVGSNGGANQVAIFLVVAAPLVPTPTPTLLQPTQVPPTQVVPTQVPEGRICKLPSSLDFGTVLQGQKATQPLIPGNCGGTSFTWRAQSGDTWVAVANSGGTLSPDTTTTLNVTIDTSAFSGPGTYQSTVTFFTSVGNQTVNILVTVVAPTPTPTPPPQIT